MASLPTASDILSQTAPICGEPRKVACRCLLPHAPMGRFERPFSWRSPERRSFALIAIWGHGTLAWVAEDVRNLYRIGRLFVWGTPVDHAESIDKAESGAQNGGHGAHASIPSGFDHGGARLAMTITPSRRSWCMLVAFPWHLMRSLGPLQDLPPDTSLPRRSLSHWADSPSPQAPHHASTDDATWAYRAVWRASPPFPRCS